MLSPDRSGNGNRILHKNLENSNKVRPRAECRDKDSTEQVLTKEQTAQQVLCTLAPKILQSTRELHGRWTSFGRKQNEKHKHHRSHYISWVLIKRKLIDNSRKAVRK